MCLAMRYAHARHATSHHCTRRRTIVVTTVPPVRVAAVPSAHPYVSAITDPRHVTVLSDPPPPGAPAGQWWPPQVLLPEWLAAHADEFDLVHVHFGIESYSPDELRATVATLHRLGRPLVYTVHDLENPQLSAQDTHRASLAVLADGADALLALTDTAGASVRDIARRPVTVIAHPTLLGDAARPTGDAHDTVRVGVHLRDLRPNIDGVGTTATLVRAVAHLRAQGARVEAVVRMNERVRDAEAAASIALIAEGADGVTIERGTRLDDDALAAWLADLDACLLPYRHGTQSGWAELCYDLAVPVVSTPVGHIAAQHPADFHAFDMGEPVSLARAIMDATGPASSSPGSAARSAEVERRRTQRRAELDSVRAAHVAVYRRVLAAEVAA
ncbi:glycosyltransferase [Microbacterium sp. 22296]|uniref:glycosyltransferase n=1 Tax=Microbacterium sp. 22296 TaxID=3453903 RepID=UPI003F87CA3C